MLLPPRRWFQWKLSTWFVLVAGVAWTLAMRPYLGYQGRNPPTMNMLIGDIEGRHSVLVLAITGPGQDRLYAVIIGPFPWLFIPALALAAFVGWKAAWTIWRRSYDRIAGTESKLQRRFANDSESL